MVISSLQLTKNYRSGINFPSAHDLLDARVFLNHFVNPFRMIQSRGMSFI